MTILQINDLKKSYKKDEFVLKGLNTKINDGEFVVVIGPSGAGKSTFIRCINKMVDITSGELIFNNLKVSNLKGRKLRFLRSQIGMIFQHYNLIGRTNVIKNVLHGLIISLCIFAFTYIDVNPIAVLTSGPGLIEWMISNFFPLNFTNINVFILAAFDTILFAIVGTYISAILSFVLGIFLSEELMPNGFVRAIFRFIISFFRNIPVLVWTSILVFVFGIGNLVGLIALILATVGFLARSYAESINEIAGSKLEAMRASGANFFQIIFHGLIPEFIPSWINWTLFSFEINIRASAILGVVGAGGIGILMQSNLNLRNFSTAATLIFILVAIVLITEFFVNIIRRLI